MAFVKWRTQTEKTSGLKENGYRSLATQILLAEEIAAIYESSYGYFKANSRFKLEKMSVIERLERIQYVTQGTLSYTATHPEYLRQVNSTQGIFIGNRVYNHRKQKLFKIHAHMIYMRIE